MSRWSALGSQPDRHRIYEPWLRVMVGADVEASAGIEIVDEDDGA